ncbi:MAG TPA: reverse transcriptase domain-containing protein [Candidatus Paceibacterota bacterium]
MNFEKLLEGFLDFLPDESLYAPAFRRFVRRDVNPVSGVVKEKRVLFEANPAMQMLQERFRDYVRFLDQERLNKLLCFATAFRPGNTTVENVAQHRFQRFFYLVDLKKAYPSVQVEDLVRALTFLDSRWWNQGAKARDFLEQYFFDKQGGGLYTGGTASNDLFNLCLGFSIDLALGELCARHSIKYTRWVDDLTLSSPYSMPIEKATRREIRAIIERTSFKVNHRKSQYLDIEKGPVFINGIGIKKGGILFLPRPYLRMLLGLVHRAMTKGDVDPASVHGRMGVFFSISPNHMQWNKSERRLADEYERFKRMCRSRR